jgi:hypothetical protein
VFILSTGIHSRMAAAKLKEEVTMATAGDSISVFYFYLAVCATV